MRSTSALVWLVIGSTCHRSSCIMANARIYMLDPAMMHIAQTGVEKGA